MLLASVRYTATCQKLWQGGACPPGKVVPARLGGAEGSLVEVADGGVAGVEVGGEFVGGDPDGAFNLLFCLGVGFGAVALIFHQVPVCGLEVEEAVAVVGVECVAEVVEYFEVVNAALLFHFAYGCVADLLVGLLHPFGEVPYSVVEDYKVFALFVGDYSSCCGDGCEVRCDSGYGTGLVFC